MWKQKYKEAYSVCGLNILCGSFTSVEKKKKSNCDNSNSVFDALWGVFNICQEEKESQVFFISFSFDETWRLLVIYTASWAYTMSCCLIKSTSLPT